MSWYLIHTKPRQEHIALENLQRQGYEAYLPMLTVEKIRDRKLTLSTTALFPRYCFLKINEATQTKGTNTIRSTKGVSKLITFGGTPAELNDELMKTIRQREQQQEHEPQQLFRPGDELGIKSGPFAGLDAVYQMNDGEERVMVLIELMSKQVRLALSPDQVNKKAA